MADPIPDPDEKARRLTLAITERQITAAIAMRFDPENWKLTPIEGTTRTFYRRVAPRKRRSQ